MARFVLDSDILSYLLQRHQAVFARFLNVVWSDDEIYLCPAVYYEVRRGLLHRGASRQLQQFDQVISDLLWAEYQRPMWEDAAELYAISRRQGRPHDDADLLIASFARFFGATLVTSNISDFEDLGVDLENWVV